MHVHFETLGCKLNQIETESLAQFFLKTGFDVSMKSITAHSCINEQTILCVVNTCTVTGKAEQKARRVIRLLLRKNPLAVVLVTGCYAAVEEKEIETIDFRVVTISGQLKNELAYFPQDFFNFLQQSSNWDSASIRHYIVLWKMQRVKSNQVVQKTQFMLSTDNFMIHTRASLKIQDGCNSACSYCRIRLARGKSVSLSVQEVLERVQQLEQGGHSEVVLTGVNLSQYKGTFFSEQSGSEYDFSKLLQFLLDNTKTISFRISSLYPEQITAAFCSVIAHKRVRPHFHLSVQSGSNSILRAMNRSYSAEDILCAVKLLNQTKENPFIACDIIAGFPGETPEDFAATVQLCTACNFSWIHAFSFSARPNTAATLLSNQIKAPVIQERIARLIQLACAQKEAYCQKWQGKILFAIIEKGRGVPVRAVTENFLHIELTNDFTELEDKIGTETQICLTHINKITGNEGEIEAKATLF